VRLLSDEDTVKGYEISSETNILKCVFILEYALTFWNSEKPGSEHGIRDV